MENLFILKMSYIIEKIMYNQSFRNFRAKTRYSTIWKLERSQKKDDIV